jgi:hypothetical protein
MACLSSRAEAGAATGSQKRTAAKPAFAIDLMKWVSSYRGGAKSKK